MKGRRIVMLTVNHAENTSDFLDQDWVNLMKEAKRLGINRKEVKDFLNSNPERKALTPKYEKLSQKDPIVWTQPGPFITPL